VAGVRASGLGSGVRVQDLEVGVQGLAFRV